MTIQNLPELKKYIIVWNPSAMSLTCHLQSGWMLILKTSRSFLKYGFHRIILLKCWILTILSCKSLKKTDKMTHKKAAADVSEKNTDTSLRQLCYSFIISLIILLFSLQSLVFQAVQTYSSYSFLHLAG